MLAVWRGGIKLTVLLQPQPPSAGTAHVHTALGRLRSTGEADRLTEESGDTRHLQQCPLSVDRISLPEFLRISLPSEHRLKTEILRSELLDCLSADGV